MNDMETALRRIAEAYNEIPYTSYPHQHTHPSRIAAHCTLRSLSTVPVESAKILELGCCAGENIIPLALHYPNAECIGIDIADQQIAIGKEKIAFLSLKNIRMIAQSFTDFTSDQRFDYIICHGVYSWVPPTVQQHILRIISTMLSDSGVAYISFNTLPGWNLKQISRDLLFFKKNIDNRKKTSPEERAKEARSLLQFAADNAIGTMQPLFSTESTLFQNSEDYYLHHEYLEPYHSATYVTDFFNQLNEFGLFPIGSADLFDELFPYRHKDIHDAIMKLRPESPKIYAQYADFLIGKTFRSMLVTKRSCKEESLEKSIDKNALKKVHFIMNTHPAKEFVSNTTEQSFEENLYQESFLHTLRKTRIPYPRTLSFEEISRELHQSSFPLPDEKEVIHLLWNALISNELLLFHEKYSCNYHAEFPRVSANTQYDVSRGSSHTTTPLLDIVPIIGTNITHFLPLINGDHSIEKIIQESTNLFRKGILSIPGVETTEASQDMIKDFVHTRINEYAQAGILEQVPG